MKVRLGQKAEVDNRTKHSGTQEDVDYLYT